MAFQMWLWCPDVLSFILDHDILNKESRRPNIFGELRSTFHWYTKGQTLTSRTRTQIWAGTRQKPKFDFHYLKWNLNLPHIISHVLNNSDKHSGVNLQKWTPSNFLCFSILPCLFLVFSPICWYEALKSPHTRSYLPSFLPCLNWCSCLSWGTKRRYLFGDHCFQRQPKGSIHSLTTPLSQKQSQREKSTFPSSIGWLQQ